MTNQRSEKSKRLQELLVKTYEVLENYDFWAEDPAELLEEGAELLLMTGRLANLKINLIAIFAPNSAFETAVPDAVTFWTVCDEVSSRHQITKDQASPLRNILSEN